MVRSLIKLDYQGLIVGFNEDGWFNATAAAAHYGKEVYEWLRLPETQRYLDALSRRHGINRENPGFWIKTRRGKAGGTWLHPRLGVRFAQWLNVDFAVWCDEQIEGFLKGQHPHFDWKRSRHEAASSNKVMNAVLQLHRQMQGKPSARQYFINEAKLINWALTGEFQGLDRERLATGELDLLAKLEERNTVLIGCGLGRDERKLALKRFARDWPSRALDVPPCP